MSEFYFLRYHELVLSRIVSGVTKLYDHQREALLALYQKACRGEMDGAYRQAGLVLAGVGTGKTVMQSIAPFILAPWMRGSQALFLSDNCTLRSRFLKDFPTDCNHRPHYDRWPLYSLGILPPGVPPPQIVELDASKFESYAYAIDKADMLVANRQFFVNLTTRGDIEPDRVGLIVIDEAHFSAANSYRSITNYLRSSLLTYFTGSKFRSDAQPLPHIRYTEVLEADKFGNTVVKYSPIADYEFTLQQAWQLSPPPIKKLTLQEATSDAFLVEEDGEEVAYQPDEFFAKAERDRLWFRQILFADRFTLPVLHEAIDILLKKRQATGQPHAAIVRALNIPHVHRVAQLLDREFPVLKNRVGIVHSERDGYDLNGRASDILNQFYNGDLWVLVHCGTIGVGFDHQFASVSCCLCVLKSMAPAEQEWGRIIRRVPGASPGNFPILSHPNWGVVVTHESLQIGDLFEKFVRGITSDTLKEVVTPPRPSPILKQSYEAGETVLTLTDTSNLQPGDILQISAWMEMSQPPSPKFDLEAELDPIDRLSEMTVIPAENEVNLVKEKDTEYRIATVEDENVSVGANASQLGSIDSVCPIDNVTPFSNNGITAKERDRLPWESEANAIGERLQTLRQQKNFEVRIEAILDNQRVQIPPACTDIPQGATVKKERSRKILPDAHFLGHVNLDWQVWVGDKLMSYRQYKQHEILSRRGLELDATGEILSGGDRLRDMMPAAAFDLFLKGLEAEMASVELEVPTNDITARPDRVKLDIQTRYGGQVRSLIADLFRPSGLISDGTSGRSLVDRPVELLENAIDRLREKGKDLSMTTNQQLLHAAVFGYIKDTTGRRWSEHDEPQYKEAYKLARLFVLKLREQLQWRR